MPSYTPALDIINAFVVIVGVPSLVAALIYVGRQFQKLDTLNATMEAVKHNINLCMFALIKMNKLEGDKVHALSPASLTREGYEYLGRVGVKDAIDHETYGSDLLGRIDRNQPGSKYDVEISAIQTMFAALTDTSPEMRAVKIYLYNHPDEGLPAIAYLAGLYLRDRYLAAHPEIAQ